MEEPLEFDDIIKKIFSKPPQEPCTIFLQIDNPLEASTTLKHTNNQLEMQIERQSKEELKKNFLLDIMFKGIKYIWNIEELELEKVSVDDFETIKKYMKSIGYNPRLIRYWREEVGYEKKVIKFEIYFEELWNSNQQIKNLPGQV